jgi:hypothetical protein
MPRCKDDADMDNDSSWGWGSSWGSSWGGDSSSVSWIVRLIVGAIIVGLLILLIIWAQQFIGFAWTSIGAVFIIVLAVLGLIWLFRSAKMSWRSSKMRSMGSSGSRRKWSSSEEAAY